MAEVMTIEELRGRIDVIDDQLVRLLNVRVACAVEIGRLKHGQGLPIYQPDREKQVLEQVRAAAVALSGALILAGGTGLRAQDAGEVKPEDLFASAKAAYDGKNGSLGKLWAWLSETLDRTTPATKADDARLAEVRRVRKENFADPGRHGDERRQLVPGRSWAAWARALGLLLPEIDVADLGCGEGYLTLESARWARHVTAVDRSREVLARYVWLPLVLGTALFLLTYLWPVPLWVVVALQLSFFIAVGRVTPNVAALALAPHGAEAGAASALMGALQSALAMLSPSVVRRQPSPVRLSPSLPSRRVRMIGWS